MMAAATTSLPERLEGGRNYDYRYAWIRDQCYAGLAVAAHGPHPLLAGAVRFVSERLLDDGPDLLPAYTVSGRPIPPERRLRLRGFPAGSARAGNWVRGQFQLDALGETLSLFAAAAAEGPPGGHGHREAARRRVLADGILASLGDAVHPSGRWQRAPDDDRVDAALLMPVIRKGSPPRGPAKPSHDRGRAVGARHRRVRLPVPERPPPAA